jgi:hypothetical protein
MIPVWEEFEPGDKAGDDLCFEKKLNFRPV